MKKIFLSSLVLLVGLMGFALFVPTSQATDAPFLCPVVGDGVNNADVNNGENGVSTLDPAPAVGTSFLPGNNQAGANSNPNAHNASGPGDPDAGPGHNSDFSPIWPHS